MIDALTGSTTAFDLTVIVIVILSALMGLSRGFMRELGTIAALFFATLAAYFGRIYFRDSIENLLPDGVSQFAPDFIIIVGAFVVTYVIIRMLGDRFSKLVQGTGEIVLADRIAGLVFGVARGLAFPFLFAWLLLNFAPNNAVPDVISKSATYPIFERAVITTGLNTTNASDQADETVETSDDSPQDDSE